ncbi:hypothetical protein [Lichenifustis flavocetrariae]|uniref:hypothetical protein n=1 Tax=Lichenifustis flavocetrariae TaxID=2949735 RepID=UPI003D132E95
MVREALRHLESEGLVDVIPQQGSVVADRHGRDILRTTTEFYELLFGIADKPVACRWCRG